MFFKKIVMIPILFTVVALPSVSALSNPIKKDQSEIFSLVIKPPVEVGKNNLQPKRTPPQIAILPNLIKTTKMKRLNSTELEEIAQLLKDETALSKGIKRKNNVKPFGSSSRLLVASFTSDKNEIEGAHHIRFDDEIFEVFFRKGPVYRVSGRTNHDDKVIIQIPFDTFKVYLFFKPKTLDEKLEIEDSLYHVSDTLGKNDFFVSDQHFLNLGLRTLPIPKTWKNSSGSDLRVAFRSRNVSSFKLLILREESKLPLPPPGIKEIGPDGGTLELPGVGRVEIPEGALDRKVTVRLSQKTVFLKVIASVSAFERIPAYTYHDYVSAIMKIEPMGQRLKKTALVYLDIDKQRVGANSPGVVDWVVFNEYTPLNEIVTSAYAKLPKKHSEPLKITSFSYVTRVIDEMYGPDDSYEVDRVER